MHCTAQLIPQIVQSIEAFVKSHAVGDTRRAFGIAPIAGEFSLFTDRTVPDLYGMVDGVYTLFCVNLLKEVTDCPSRHLWAQRILDCQDEDGWFSKRNLRGHSREHATAYAIGALKLLEVGEDECYVDRIKPLVCLLPILTDYDIFERWMRRLGFRVGFDDFAGNLGWSYIWRASHLAGGVAAVVGMVQHRFSEWWGKRVKVSAWFEWFFDWLDREINPKTGYWQRAFWNLVFRKPTIIDLGGAAHFLWIYDAYGHPFPYPEQSMLSTIALQKESGLYRSYPMCIDLDGNFCAIRSYLQLVSEKQIRHEAVVARSVEASFDIVVSSLASRPLTEIYRDSHGLPGALAALVECAKFPGFRFADAVKDWQHPLDRAWWL